LSCGRTSANLVDAGVGADGVGHLSGVAGDHHHAHAAPVQGVDRRARLAANLVLEGERSGDLTVADDVQHRRTTRARQASTAPSSCGGGWTLSSRRSAGPPTATVVPSTPRPGSARKSSPAGMPPLR
jgi:hypothetical protein